MSPEPPPLQGVATALRLLRELAEHRQLGVREAARLLGVTPTSAQRLLRTLQSEGFATRSPTDRGFVLSPVVLELANAYVARFEFASLVRHETLALQSMTRETVAFYGLQDGMRVCLAELPSPHPLRMVASPGSVKPIAGGATDKVFRAFASLQQLSRMDDRLHASDESHLAHTVPDVHELADIAQRRWATSQGARTPGSAALSVAVTPPGDLFVLSVFGPRERMDRLDGAAVRQLALDIARGLETTMPWVGGTGDGSTDHTPTR